MLYICSHKAATKLLLSIAAASAFFAYYFKPQFGCAIEGCYVDVYTIDDVRESHLEKGARKVRRSIQTDWTFNFMTRHYYAKLRTGTGSGVTEPNVYELDAQHQRRVVSGIEDDSNRNYVSYKYPISVNNYHAVGFLVYNGDLPQVSGYSGEYLTKDLQIDIQPPDGVDLLPCEGERFSSGIEPSKYADPLHPLCVVSNKGRTLTCTNINLPAGQDVNYYFRHTAGTARATARSALCTSDKSMEEGDADTEESSPLLSKQIARSNAVGLRPEGGGSRASVERGKPQSCTKPILPSGCFFQTYQT